MECKNHRKNKKGVADLQKIFHALLPGLDIALTLVGVKDACIRATASRWVLHSDRSSQVSLEE